MRNQIKKIVLSSALATTLLLPISAYAEANPSQQTTTYPTSVAVKNPASYMVKKGDTLFSIAKQFHIEVVTLKRLNHLSSNIVGIGENLLIPSSNYTPAVTQQKNSAPVSLVKNYPDAIKTWPSLTYIVKSGDTLSSVAKRFKISVGNLMAFNYMKSNDWFNAGQKIAINGFAPRNFEAVPGEASKAEQVGKPLDWFLDGQYILKRNKTLRITDTKTGKSFQAKVMGGMNHADIEPLTQSDMKVMKSLFGKWKWSPRPVAIFVEGMNIAGSLSGMPHSFDTTPKNGVKGHFDLYLKNSKPHNPKTSKNYIQQHRNNIPLSTAQQ